MKSKNSFTKIERVKIWNTLFGLAFTEAADINKKPKIWKPVGGKLNKELTRKLRLLIFLVMAMETRATHLIYEAVGKNILKEQADSLTYLNFQKQWELLPVIYKRPKKFGVTYGDKKTGTTSNHDVIKELKDFRDKLFHADLEQIYKYISKKTNNDIVKYVVQSWDAMEDMNILTGRRVGSKTTKIVRSKVDSLR